MAEKKASAPPAKKAKGSKKKDTEAEAEAEEQTTEKEAEAAEETAAEPEESKESDADPEPAKSKGKAKGKGKGDDAAAAAAAPASAGPVDVDLSGKKFVVMGGFTCDKFKIESTISNVGGEVTKAVLKSLDYVVCGTPEATKYGGVSGPGSKMHREAKKAKIPILSEAEFESLVEQHKATQLRLAASIQSGLIPDLANIVAGYADSSAEGVGAQWAEICGWWGIKNTPAKAEDIAAAESRIRIAFPPFLKQLWRVASNMGSEKGNHPPHPEYFFPSVQEIVDMYEGKRTELDYKATNIWRSLRLLPLFNYCEAGDQYTCIDLTS